jgi:hypothetical protein
VSAHEFIRIRVPRVKLLFNPFQFHKLFVGSTTTRRIHLSAGHKASIAQFLPGAFVARHVDGKFFATAAKLEERYAKAPVEQPSVTVSAA